ncbi:MAG: NAD(+) diphosphatase [Microbacteriaceae bacterium]|nr:MAG: NAD(+) diphosphatase [Microbacteriaceae bacterium]
MPHSWQTRLPLTRAAVDRDAGRRMHPALFDELLEDQATRLLPLWGGRALLQPATLGATTLGATTLDATTADAAIPAGATPAGATPTAPALALLPTDAATSALVRVYLGLTLEASVGEPAGTPVIAVVLTDAAAAELESAESCWANLRSVAAGLSDRDAGLFTEALAITNWHAAHTHCPRCGTPTVVEQGGWLRRCLVDDNEVFPRTDPAVIAAVLDADGRLLLGSNAMWENNRWSLLAGFVEAGESFESAVAREILEESGMRVVGPEYLASQPWPFPASIMVGFRCRIAGSQDPAALRPDGEEILALRWFSREELWRERDELLLPGSSSIAHAIVADWYGGPLDGPPGRPG